jgi:hypothetical protein
MKHFIAWLSREAQEAWPIACFFFVGFVIVLLIVKLSLEQYSIQTAALSRAFVGAIIAAKVVLVLDNTRIAQSFRGYPRIVPVIAKTAVYAVCVILLRILELALDSLRYGSMADSILPDLIHGGSPRLLAVILGVSTVFAIYFILAEIAEHLGSGVLWNLFFGGGAARETPRLMQSVRQAAPPIPIKPRIDPTLLSDGRDHRDARAIRCGALVPTRDRGQPTSRDRAIRDEHRSRPRLLAVRNPRHIREQVRMRNLGLARNRIQDHNQHTPSTRKSWRRSKTLLKSAKSWSTSTYTSRHVHKHRWCHSRI